MRYRLASLIGLTLAAPLLLAGCGHAPATAAVRDLQVSSPVQPIVIPVSKIHAAPSPTVGVEVNGRTYAAGAVPSAAPSAAPAAPSAGDGNLEVDVNLAGKISFTNALRVIVHQPGQTQVLYSHDFTGSDLELTKLSTVAPNLAPGAYQVLLQYYNQSDALYKQDVSDASVTAGQTASATF